MLIENGDKSGAEDVLEKAAKIKIETDTDKYNLAKLHYYQGDYSTALTEFNKCVSKGFKEADYYIGEIYRSKKDFDKAIYYYENYIKSGTANTSNVYNQMGVCLIKTGEYKKAANYLEKGIAYGDTGTLKSLKKNVITAYENMGDFDTAKEILKDYLKNYPNDKDALREKEFIDTRINKPQIHK
jgi:tetratricopeptide (TPR) repeat protein